MDTLTFITIITALATLIGAISPIIVAFIQSNKDKQRNSILLPTNVVLEPRTKINWLVVFSFAILSGIIGYNGAKIIGFEPSTLPTSETLVQNETNTALSTTVTEKTKTPNSTSTPIIKTSPPQQSTILPNDSSILFSEDFEDGKSQQVSYSSKEWQIITDETGNNVYDVDNSKGGEFPRIYIGSNSWKNYEINFRARIISGSWVIICFRESETTGGNYVVDVYQDIVTLYYTTNGGDWTIITARQHNLPNNEWHWFNIQVRGPEIKVTINDVVVIFTDDTRHTYGQVVLQAGQYTHMQYDDIKVTSLEK